MASLIRVFTWRTLIWLVFYVMAQKLLSFYHIHPSLYIRDFISPQIRLSLPVLPLQSRRFCPDDYSVICNRTLNISDTLINNSVSVKNAFKTTNELLNMSLVGITISIALFHFGEAICLQEMTDCFHRFIICYYS